MRILIIDDDKEFLKLFGLTLKKEGFSVLTSQNIENALSVLEKNDIDLIFLDQYLGETEGTEAISILKNKNPDIPVVILTAYGNLKDAIDAIKKGAFNYLTKPVDRDELNIVINQVKEITTLKKEISNLKDILSTDIIAESPVMKSIFKNAEKIAPFDITVLITGESGTGKEVLARFIHKKSKRSKEPFVAINCGAIPHELLESELFGYKKGAFTGANRDKKGLIEEADKGTLFLDEIGELPLDLQVKLLRVLEEGEIRPLGSTKSKKVDIRLIAATNRNLEKLVKEGKFREDLYFRLKVVHFHIPPLRERKEDIVPLAKLFIKKYSKKYGIPEKKLSEKAIQELISHDWKGNVRELEHLIEKTIIMSEGNSIETFDEISTEGIYIRPFKEEKEEFEKNYLKRLLLISKGNISKASKISGKTRAEIYRLMKKYGINKLY